MTYYFLFNIYTTLKEVLYQSKNLVKNGSLVMVVNLKVNMHYKKISTYAFLLGLCILILLAQQQA